jgi:hypothetical protein
VSDESLHTQLQEFTLNRFNRGFHPGLIRAILSFLTEDELGIGCSVSSLFRLLCTEVLVKPAVVRFELLYRRNGWPLGTIIFSYVKFVREVGAIQKHQILTQNKEKCVATRRQILKRDDTDRSQYPSIHPSTHLYRSFDLISTVNKGKHQMHHPYKFNPYAKKLHITSLGWSGSDEDTKFAAIDVRERKIAICELSSEYLREFVIDTRYGDRYVSDRINLEIVHYLIFDFL